VAEAFYLTTSIEKYGSGFIRIRQSLLDYPEVQFTIEELSGGLCLTFTKPAAEEGGGVNEGVNEGVNGLLSLIKKQPGLRTTGLATQLNTSPKNLERWLKQLKVQGLIEFRGAPKTGGYHPKTGGTE
jgi:ATP-dependent DNA helicase RecG